MTEQNKYSTTPRDYTHVGPVPQSIATGKQLGKVDPTSQSLARDIRNFAWAEDTQESIARFIEWCSILYNFTTDRNDFIDFSVGQMNTQFSDVLKELSEDKDYYSLPEIAGARGGFDTLGDRLNDFKVRMEDVIQSADLDPNKDQEIVDARLGRPTLGAKIADVEKEIKSLERKVGEATTYNDYSDLTLDREFATGVTRIINEEITSPTTLTEINIAVRIAGDALIKIFKKVGELTFDLVEEFTIQLDVGDNVIEVRNKLVAGTYIGVHPQTALIRSKVGVGTPSLFLSGDIKGDGNKFSTTTSILGVSFKTFTAHSDSPTNIPYDYSSNLMQLFPTYTTVGDSLTAGFTSVDGTGSGSADAAQTKNNWPGFLSLRTGRTFNNIAVGGSTSKDWRDTHLQTGNIPTDCYIVALGVNDARQALTVGSPADIASDKNLNADTFYGNYDFVVRGLLDFNPTKEIFVLTIPAHESNAETYNVAIRHIAGLYENVHLIDMYNIYYHEYTTGFLPNNYISTHYTPLSYNYISTMIERAINEYLFDNFEYFQKAPYK